MGPTGWCCHAATPPQAGPCRSTVRSRHPSSGHCGRSCFRSLCMCVHPIQPYGPGAETVPEEADVSTPTGMTRVQDNCTGPWRRISSFGGESGAEREDQRPRSPSMPSTAETWMLLPDGRTVSRNDCGAGLEAVGPGKQAAKRANKGEGRSFGQIFWAAANGAVGNWMAATSKGASGAGLPVVSLNYGSQRWMSVMSLRRVRIHCRWHECRGTPPDL